MRLTAIIVGIGCAPSYDHALASTDRRLASIEQRVNDADRHAMVASSAASSAASAALRADTAAASAANACNTKQPAPLVPQWSCAANCVKSYSCESNGTNNVKWKVVTSSGSTAADAFLALTRECNDELYVDGRCTGGKWVRIEATLVNACTRN